MTPRIQSFVHEPRRNQKEFDQPLWTNNNSESVNHIFKRAVNWKPQTTPDLVENLYDCVQIQLLHLRGCLHGHGDYVSAFIKSRYPVLLPGYGSVWYRQKK